MPQSFSISSQEARFLYRRGGRVAKTEMPQGRPVEGTPSAPRSTPQAAEQIQETPLQRVTRRSKELNDRANAHKRETSFDAQSWQEKVTVLLGESLKKWPQKPGAQMTSEDIQTIDGILNTYEQLIKNYETAMADRAKEALKQNTQHALQSLAQSITPLQRVTQPIDNLRSLLTKFRPLSPSDEQARTEALRRVDLAKEHVANVAYAGTADDVYKELLDATNLINARLVSVRDTGFVAVQKDVDSNISVIQDYAATEKKNFPKARVLTFRVPADGVVSLQYSSPGSTKLTEAKFSDNRAGNYAMGWQVERQQLSTGQTEYVVRFLRGMRCPFQLQYNGKNLLNFLQRVDVNAAFEGDALAVGRAPLEERPLPIITEDEFRKAWTQLRSPREAQEPQFIATEA